MSNEYYQRHDDPIEVKSPRKTPVRLVRGLILTAVVVIIAVVLLGNSVFVVGEAEQAVVNRLGVINKVIVNYDNTFVDKHPELMNTEGSPLQNVTVSRESGLYFKIPFIEKVEK